MVLVLAFSPSVDADSKPPRQEEARQRKLRDEEAAAEEAMRWEEEEEERKRAQAEEERRREEEAARIEQDAAKRRRLEQEEESRKQEADAGRQELPELVAALRGVSSSVISHRCYSGYALYTLAFCVPVRSLTSTLRCDLDRARQVCWFPTSARMVFHGMKHALCSRSIDLWMRRPQFTERAQEICS